MHASRAKWPGQGQPHRWMERQHRGTVKHYLAHRKLSSAMPLWHALALSLLQGALFGGVIATSFTWPTVARLSASDQATVIAIWYSALLFAITSIATSAQQVVVLRRLGSHPEGLEKIRTLLGKNAANGPPKPRNLQLFIWQAPLSLLNLSGVMFVVGLIVLVWKSVSLGGNDTKVWAKIVLVTSSADTIRRSSLCSHWRSLTQWLYMLFPPMGYINKVS